MSTRWARVGAALVLALVTWGAAGGCRVGVGKGAAAAAGTETEAGTDTDTDTDADTEPGTGTGTGTDAGADAGAATEPGVASPRAVILDAVDGRELWSRAPDEVVPIASMTKIFVALVLRQHGLALTGTTEITAVDAAAAKGGATSDLPRAATFRNRDLLHSMLLVSDNRVPTALARSVGLSPAQLLAEMQATAARLGLTHTTFVDVTGIGGNQSTAREIALALRAALADDVLAKIMSTRRVEYTSIDGAHTVKQTSTVRPLWHRRAKVRGGKTGHTDGAGYCMTVQATVHGRAVVMAFLGAADAGTRYADFGRVVDWAEAGGL